MAENPYISPEHGGAGPPRLPWIAIVVSVVSLLTIIGIGMVLVALLRLPMVR